MRAARVQLSGGLHLTVGFAREQKAVADQSRPAAWFEPLILSPLYGSTRVHKAQHDWLRLPGRSCSLPQPRPTVALVIQSR